MASTIEERLAALEARLDKVEVALAEMQRSRRPAFGMTIEEAKERLKTPAEYGPEQIEKFRRIIGRFEGPEDLSENMREYLYGERDE